MALSATQLADFQADLAISNDETVFTDEELERLFERAESNYNLAVYYGWRQVLAGSAKWVNYRVAQTQVDKAQAFDHIKAMVAFWADESRTTANQVAIVGMRPVPTVWKNEPADEYTAQGNKTNRSHANWRNW